MPTRATLEFLEENGIPETTTKPPTTANAAEQDRKEQEQPYNSIESKIWGEIKPFEEVTPHEKFNLNLLPDKMGEYVQAVSDYTDTAPEMGILPLFSVLALCLQGKAVVKHPANSHTKGKPLLSTLQILTLSRLTCIHLQLPPLVKENQVFSSATKSRLTNINTVITKPTKRKSATTQQRKNFLKISWHGN